MLLEKVGQFESGVKSCRWGRNLRAYDYDLCSPDKPERKTYLQLVEIAKGNIYSFTNSEREGNKERKKTQYIEVLKNLVKSCYLQKYRNLKYQFT